MTTFYLLEDIDFGKDYNGVVSFDSPSHQRDYFNDKRVMSFDYPTTYNYIRGERNSLRVEIPKLIVDRYSYCQYTNKTPEGYPKTFYAFIDEVRYIDPNTSQIFFTIDVWQTYMWDYEVKDAFIDREHQDRFGFDSNNEYKPIFNTNPENIEVGEDYEIIDSRELDDFGTQIGNRKLDIQWLLTLTMDNSGVQGEHSSLKTYNIDSGMYAFYTPYLMYSDYRFSIKNLFTGGDEPQQIYFPNQKEVRNHFIENEATILSTIVKYVPFKFDYEYKGNSIVEIDVIQPVESPDVFNYVSIGEPLERCLCLREIDLTNIDSDIGTIKNDFNYSVGYNIPREIKNETKLYQYPYNFFNITNYRGEGLAVKPEYIGSEEKSIKYIPSISPQSKNKVFIEDYLGDDFGREKGYIDNTLSELPLRTDLYKQYMSNSKATATTGVAINTGLGVAGTIAGVALLGSGGAGGALAFMALGLGLSGFAGVQSELMKQSDLKQAPNNLKQQGNDLLFDIMNDNLNYRIVNKRIRKEYFDRLYEYFYRFGYKANRFGKLNARSRFYFNYIKTIEINIVGNINNNVKEQLKDIYNNGTTIWHARQGLNENPELWDYHYENIEMSVL